MMATVVDNDQGEVRSIVSSMSYDISVEEEQKRIEKGFSTQVIQVIL